MSDTRERLADQVLGVAAELEDAGTDATEWLDGALDIEYVIGQDRGYRGARVLVSFGGPNVWVDTRRMVVEGHWGSDSVEVAYADVIGLYDVLAGLWSMGVR